MEVMLEEEVVRERARRVIPADGTKRRETPINIPLTPQRLAALWEHLDALMQPQKKC